MHHAVSDATLSSVDIRDCMSCAKPSDISVVCQLERTRTKRISGMVDNAALNVSLMYTATGTCMLCDWQHAGIWTSLEDA
jgi:hypothetical protein